MKDLKKTWNNEKKKTFFLFIMLLVMLIPAYSANGGTAGTDGMAAIKKIFGTVYWFFCSTYMKVICIAAVAIIGVKIISAKGQPEIMKPLIWWLVGVILLGGASLICGLFFEPEFAVDSLTSGTNILDGLK